MQLSRFLYLAQLTQVTTKIMSRMLHEEVLVTEHSSPAS
jgi:hypothetical protein